MNQLDLGFYSSLSDNPRDLFAEKVKASSQANQILLHFENKQRQLPDGEWFKATTYQIHRETGINLNSVRRAMTDMEDKYGLLTMLTDEPKVMEQAGAWNHKWRLTYKTI